ncbi:proton channel OtopLc [Schistocerca cancellata]|uniref:proton channel OtopLc n=1 Tax=Schistocerca cancellata TaxID=274614 RepID=UPI00211894CF|nr:proton channel OtopLc [Schistocerca cancellata]
MQRCPYLHEMKERLLSQSSNPDQTSLPDSGAAMDTRAASDVLEVRQDPVVGTVVKLNPDGYGSHTSPAHHCSSQLLDESADMDSFAPKNAKTSLFIILSFIYAKLLIVICIAYVISEVVTQNIPLHYYEGFFTYLYGMSILFLLYVFCFLLQESACCAPEVQAPPPRPPVKKSDAKKAEKEKKKKKKKAAEAKEKGSAEKMVELESGRPARKRKTSQNIHSHGSFFLRVGAIAFGLGTMIYNGLECGAFFEIPFNSPCYQILRGINPVLQMIFTFMQMYFIFMNSRLNIHRFKVVARFGLMHVVATNLCVWIRTLVLESLKEISAYQHRRLESFLAADEDSGVELIRGPSIFDSAPGAPTLGQGTTVAAAAGAGATSLQTTARTAAHTIARITNSTLRAILEVTLPPTTPSTTVPSTTVTTTAAPTTTLHTTSTAFPTTLTTQSPTTTPITTTTASTTTTTTTTAATIPTTALFSQFPTMLDSMDYPRALDVNGNSNGSIPFLDGPFYPAALTSLNNGTSITSGCGRVNIMGTIVQDSAPYLFPFIIEYSLIGAAVIYVMWRHIGRHPRYVEQEDLEQRLEAMLSRRAVAMAQARRQGRVDCVGASKGLFCGLLLLVASLICLILFFVMIHHQDYGLLAIYLADVSHCVLMSLSIIATIVGFIRVQSLKFRAEEQSDLNDILLRVSAFGLFVYAVFSVIAGSLAAFPQEPKLLIVCTGLLSIVQVVLQLLFIADVARRRVHLPEHDRSKPGRQVVTFLLICNVTMWVIYTFEAQKVIANPVQLDFYGFLAWAIVQRVTLPLCIFHRFHSAVTLAEIWKTSYKARLE